MRRDINNRIEERGSRSESGYGARNKAGLTQSSILNPLSSKGFTLLEMIVVMVITGILGGMVAMFIRGPVQGYVDSARRADMTDIADIALWRITRDLRQTLPNSVRVSNAAAVASCNGTEICYLEFIPVTGGGRYRASSGVAGDDILDFSAPDISFDVLGPLPAFASGVSIVIDNTSASGASSVYSAYNIADCPPLAPYCASTNASTVQPAITLAAAKQFPSPSPGNSFQVISAPVTYVCDPVSGTLKRYWGYTIQATQPIDVAAAPLNSLTPALLASHVSACKFVRVLAPAPASARPELVIMQLTLTGSGESISLYGAAHVGNVP